MAVHVTAGAGPKGHEQVTSGAGLDPQRAVLIERATCEDWMLYLIADEGLSAKDMERPAPVEALETLDLGDADVIIASKLDGISRSTADSRTCSTAPLDGWRLVVADLGTDTSTDAGRFVARTIANAAEYERDLIRSRTRPRRGHADPLHGSGRNARQDVAPLLAWPAATG